jgi:hypothetical protein
MVTVVMRAKPLRSLRRFLNTEFVFMVGQSVYSQYTYEIPSSHQKNLCIHQVFFASCASTGGRPWAKSAEYTINSEFSS